MKRAFTLIELLMIIAIIFIILAIVIPAMAPRDHTPLTAAQIHVGDEVRINGNWLHHGRVVDILPARNDGEPVRVMVRVRDDQNNYVTTTFFPNELSAP